MLPASLAIFAALLCASSAYGTEAVVNQTERVPALPDALSIVPVTSTARSDTDSPLDDLDSDGLDEETTTPTVETTETPYMPEALPVAQPLVMDVSLEDMDYMTMLRPPPPPAPPGPRSGPRGRKKKQKRRRRPDPGPLQVPANPVPVPKVHYHRGYPDYAEDEQRKSRERPQEEFSLQHVDEVPFAFESIMRHVASLGEPQYHNHKSFGVDAQPSDNNAETTQHFTPVTRPPDAQNQPMQSPPHQPLANPPHQPMANSAHHLIPHQHSPHHQQNPHLHDMYQSATVQVTRSVPVGEHHSSTSGDWLLGFIPSGTTVSPFPANGISENSIEPASKSPSIFPPTFGGDSVGTSSTHFREPTGTSASETLTSPASISTSTTPSPASSTVDGNAKRATLRDILSIDCPEAEEQGYCDSPPRYPTQQVNAVLRQCADLVELLHAPLPEPQSAEDDPTSVPGEEPVCPSTRQMLRPGFVRDAASGRWFVAVQSRGRVSQLIPSEKCSSLGRSCARLADSKCARNLGFRNGVRASACRQKWTMRPILTWDPDRPTRCPQMTMVKLPDNCVCRLLPTGIPDDTLNKMER